MAESYAIFLLLILFLSIIRPISPVISDAWGHTFNKKHHQHIHEINEHHLDVQLEEVAGQDNSQPENTIQTFSLLNTFVCNTFNKNFTCEVACFAYQHQILVYFHADRFERPLLPPPKFS